MTFLAGLVLLSVLVTIHEFGHFLLARLSGVRVYTFSIGFGPRVWGFRVGETDFRISAVPLGGYVRMHGEDPSIELPPEAQAGSYLHQPFYKKFAIAAAGPAFNLVLPVVVFFFALLGDYEVPSAHVGTVMPGTPAAEAGLVSGDLITAVEGTPIAAFDDLVAAVGPAAGQPLKFTYERDGKVHHATITPAGHAVPDPLDDTPPVGRIGVTTSRRAARAQWMGAPQPGLSTGDVLDITAVDDVPVTAWADVRAAMAAPGPHRVTARTHVIDTRAAPDASGEDRGTPEARFDGVLTVQMPGEAIRCADTIARVAVTVGELTGDLADRVEETRVVTQAALDAMARAGGLVFSGGAVVDVKPDTPAAQLGLKPGARVVAINGQPVKLWQQVHAALYEAPTAIHGFGYVVDGASQVAAVRLKAVPGEEASYGLPAPRVFGHVAKSALLPPRMQTAHRGVLEAAQAAVTQTVGLVRTTAVGLLRLVQGRLSVKSVGSPVMIFDLAGRAAAKGAGTFFDLMAVLSVSVGLFNLLPVPVLDGGQIMFFIVEAVTGRPLSLKWRFRLIVAGVVLLGSLMVFAVINDVLRMLG